MRALVPSLGIIIAAIARWLYRLSCWPARFEAALDDMSHEELRMVANLLFAALSTLFWAMLIVLALTQFARVIATQGGL